ncbi:hypothetical protein [Novipirellula caenicola]|uniref:ComEC family competence protein n=1 Tax=Novipirellula caenicola TaxID=1536901 RepID=A0ABP9W1C9_9BACT
MKQPSTNLDAVFDDLKRRLDALGKNPAHDNEATRHDRLIVPVLTHPLLLGWDLNDLVGQASITLPSQLLDSHIFRGAEPKFRKPDILVTSSAFQFNALVVEEKEGQANIGDLNGYRFQLHEYQSLYECVWGLLTDGERWILKKGFESYHTFDSLDALKAGLGDLQHWIGKQSLLERKLAHGTCDLVIIVPSSGYGSFGGTVRDVTGGEFTLGNRDLLDLGQARSTILMLGDRRAIVLNGATQSAISELRQFGIRRLELIMIDSNDRDHVPGMKRLLDEYRHQIGRIYVSADRPASSSSIFAMLAERHHRDNLELYRIENADEHPRVIYNAPDSQLQLSLIAPSMLENMHAMLSPHRQEASTIVTLRNAGQRFVVPDHSCSAAMATLTKKMTEHDRTIVKLPQSDATVATNIISCNSTSTDVVRLGRDNDTIDRYAVDMNGRVVPLTDADRGNA